MFSKLITLNMNTNVIIVEQPIIMDRNTHTQPSSNSMWQRFKDWNHSRRWAKRIQKRIRQGYIKKDLEPILCLNCKCKSLFWKDENCMDNIILERSVKCNECGKQVAYWCTGHWDATVHEP